MEVIASRCRTLFAAASVADYAETPDAELIRFCAEFDVLERLRQDACNTAKTIEEDDTADLIWAEVRQQQESILAQICATPAVSLEGLGAVAASLVLWDGELFVECDEPGACTNESKRKPIPTFRLGLGLSRMRAVLGGAVRDGRERVLLRPVLRRS